MKIKTKDKAYESISGTPHPLNMFSFLGQHVNPAWNATEFNGRPVQYYGGGGGMNMGGGQARAPAPSQPSPAPSVPGWTFPQYSQSWAFTPPAPTPYNPPPAFGSPAPKPGALTPFSLTELQKKYGK
jgi:hypothetical protein